MCRGMHWYKHPLQSKKQLYQDFTLKEWNAVASMHKMDKTSLKYMTKVSRETEKGRAWLEFKFKNNLCSTNSKKASIPQFSCALNKWISHLGEAEVEIEEAYGPAR